MKFVLSVALIIFTTGCAHYHRVEGPTAASVSPAGLKVRIGSSEVKQGDVVVFRKEVCTSVSSGRESGPIERCRYKELGRSKVLKVLDENSSIVATDDSFKIDRSVTVEKESL